MSRTSGRKIVSFAFAGIVGAIGLGQIYLPYIADRDKLRGLFEEGDMPAQAKQEMDMIMRAEKAAMEAQQQAQKKKENGEDKGGKSGGSMWSNLRR
mmetsp:Transcript_12185/g.18414  ORF Transcript_12185/g.18414 Transcript_12185/m.18414 type:complete len:96 (+) Transcript_12185:71-358(+)|eukprot:CAMPEP_0194078952 /NCGR_PEP_ID=MMETSP0149-20130528/5237_1 /TAXON_ID=122233 /ORGANISM="Chaetoceros debilis, Strain MM31A-1" /LENGTH=95 /DNA_ID=CAMNT_0038760309 /DNA_START=69 /DNA_END=356 /DNA_ORIENTATION=+